MKNDSGTVSHGNFTPDLTPPIKRTRIRPEDLSQMPAQPDAIIRTKVALVKMKQLHLEDET